MAGLRGGQEVTSFLYQCLKEVGLQRHCTRLAQVGVRRVAHLAALSVEDYPLLGVHSRRDRAQLLGLVQLVQALDPDEDEEEDPDGRDEGGDAAEGRCRCCCLDSGGEECGSGKAVATRAPPTPKLPTHRRLDFSCEEPGSVPKATGTLRSQPAWESCGPGQGRDPALSPVMSGQGRAPATSRQGTAASMQMQTGLSAGRAACKCSDCCRDVSAPSAAAITPPSPDRHGSRGRPPPRSPPGRASASQSDAPAGRAPPDMTQENSGSCRLSGKHTQVYERNTASGYSYGLPPRSPTAPKKKQPSTEPHISVCVRKRPLTRSEDRRGETDVVRTQDGHCLLVHEAKETVDLTHYILQHKFYFDQVFGEDSSNEEVYQMTACPLVQHLLLRGSSTCFAYGQTGAGKTHTMLGSPGAPGLYALAARDIFAHLHSLPPPPGPTPPPPGPTPPPLPPPQPQVYVSFFEIYCGQLHDLLNHRKRLFAREDGKGVVQIAGLRHVQVDSVNAVLEVVSWGREARTQGVSGVNSASSRSHALLQVQLRGPEQQLAGRMWFVDLAGSERAVDSGEPDRLGRLEAADINQSLLALKECIRSLDQEQAHTPFRQSKLTQVLRDSFVGNSKTCMIANISPGHLATEHTLNTLRYANRVKELRGHKQASGGSSASSPSDPASSRSKSPPKRAKTARPPREAVAPDDGGDPVFCSTPKRCGHGRGWGGGGGRLGAGPEHAASPVRASSRATAAGGGGGSGGGAEPLSLPGQPEEGSPSRWVSERERERHLRWYHQQLQQGHSLASSSSSSSSAAVASPPGRSSSPPAGRVESGRWAWLGATQTEQQWEEEEAGGLGGWRAGQELEASGVVDDGGGSRPRYPVPPHHRAPAERPLSPGPASTPDRPPEEQRRGGGHRGGGGGGGGAPCSCPQDESRRGCARSELLLGNNTSSTFSTSSRLKEDVHGAEEKLWEAGRTQTSVVPAVALQDPGCGQRDPTQPGDQVRGKASRPQPPARLQPQEQSRRHKRQGATEHSSAVPTTLLPSLGDLSHAQLGVVQAHWEQLEAMETLCQEEAELLCQQPDMLFRAYVQCLEGLMKRKAWCVQTMRSMLQTHLEPEEDLPATPNEQDPGGLF